MNVKTREKDSSLGAMQNTTNKNGEEELNALQQLDPCQKGLDFAKSFPSLYDAWENCENSSWMWWYLKKKNVAKELSIKYAQACAEHVKHLINRAAAYAADAAADAAYAAYAAYAADYAANAAYDAADAAYDAAADAAADADAAYKVERKWQASLIRSLVPNPFTKTS